MVKKFLDQEIFTEEFLIKWSQDDEEILKMFNSHCLYKSEFNEKLKEDAKQLIDWLQEDSEEEESDEEEESEEDDEAWIN